jgi:adrenodoxin-NADP+ reductase
MHIPDVAFEPIDSAFYPPDIKKLPRVQKRIGEVLLKGTKETTENTQKSWGLSFLSAPKSFNTSASDRLSSVTFQKQAFRPDADPFSKSASVAPTDEEYSIPVASAFRSVGYKSAAIPGLSDLGVLFDTKLGIIPNDQYGRVMTPSSGPGSLTSGHLPGLYCAGWVKRGPTGVIASTMDDAFTSAEVIASDWETNVPFLNSGSGGNSCTGLGWEGVKNDVMAKNVRPLSWNDWKVIDQAEMDRGKRVGKEREKFLSVQEMLAVLDS